MSLTTFFYSLLIVGQVVLPVVVSREWTHTECLHLMVRCKVEMDKCGPACLIKWETFWYVYEGYFKEACLNTRYNFDDCCTDLAFQGMEDCARKIYGIAVKPNNRFDPEEACQALPRISNNF